MTIEEFRVFSRLGRTKTYELLGSGELKAIKVGRRTLISSESAQAWVGTQPAYRSATTKKAA